MLRDIITKPAEQFLDYFADKENFGNITILEVCGSVGSGKSETVKELEDLIKKSENFGMGDDAEFTFLYEDIRSEETAAAIKGFYNQTMPAVELERIICSNRIDNYIKAICKKSDKKHRFIISDRSIAEDIPFIMTLRTPESKKELTNIIENIYAIYKVFRQWGLNVIQYKLDPGLDICLERIRKRNRPSEREIDKSLLAKLSMWTRVDREFDNSATDSRETALMLFCAFYRDWFETSDSQLPPPKVLVSLYGIPGSGKTTLLRAMEYMLNIPNAKFIEDISESEDIKEMQKNVYTESPERLAPSGVQLVLDKRRIAMFKEQIDNFTDFVFTDIGPKTSEIFRKVTDCEPDNTYDNALSENFDIFLNVVISPRDMETAISHIKSRGRPGEEQGLNEVYLGKLWDEIGHLNCGSYHSGKPVYTVSDINYYNQNSLYNIFDNVMWELRHAITFYFRFGTAR